MINQYQPRECTLCIEKGNYHLAGKFNYTRRGNLALFYNHYFLEKNLSGPTYLDLIFFLFFIQDSWSSDDEEGISVEELKETNGYKLFKEALQAHTKNSAKSV